ncbi:type II toxin-antitoxin system RelE/ParE family toxin [Mucilaginibacter gotjawali]|uniref:Plasmid stabilization system protein ParE n=2 Tax=Mucilaginibacter gotjawali TaxID=1550579 RepID=A0A839SJ93_9SPHI|nr:type II toxin-antitoxin system RelE/ParE family toxin [Mucilaginibacter gotjawali]MBB3057373.1 plasmid stabilization system protein ParE [Mucilaginibacter gotjawali]BAU52862.1 Plasmid stabilization system protein [Mucilaginibacter gotjawali]
MNFESIFRIEAEQDLEDIQDYYNNISPSITDNFFNEFFETMHFIEGEPTLFQVRYREIRIAPLYRFPYGIHYKETSGKIIIYRVLHTKRYFK